VSEVHSYRKLLEIEEVSGNAHQSDAKTEDLDYCIVIVGLLQLAICWAVRAILIPL